jgi:hypothetical protein
VFEAEAQEKRNLAFFSNSETHRKGRGKFGQPWKTFGKLGYGQALVLAQTRRMQVGSSVSNMPTRLTLTAKGNCFKCGKPGHFSKDCFSNKFSSRKNEEKNQYSKSQREVKQHLC